MRIPRRRGPSADHRKCNDLRRLKVELPSGRSLRLHRWVSGDPSNYQHSHPWSFTTIVLSGGYDDVADHRETDLVRAPAIRRRSTTWRHSVVDVRPRTWSIILTGRKTGSWRFWIDDREVLREEWDARVCD